MPESNGTINSISVIIDDDLWSSEVGFNKKRFRLPYLWIAQMEPVFDLKQIPTSVFSGFAINSRTILKVVFQRRKVRKFIKTKYAKPQLM